MKNTDPQPKVTKLNIFGRTVTVTFSPDSDDYDLSHADRVKAAKAAVLDLIGTYGDTQNPSALIIFGLD